MDIEFSHRAYLSGYHIEAAALFARQAKAIEIARSNTVTFKFDYKAMWSGQSSYRSHFWKLLSTNYLPTHLMDGSEGSALANLRLDQGVGLPLTLSD
jgi:hypothetical protein